MAKQFTRDDGRTMRVVKGFRKQVLLSPRVSVQPKPEWTDEDYRAAAEKKVRHSRRFVEEISRLGGTLQGARVLEVGCGAGIDCLLIGMHPVEDVLGIDMEFPLLDRGIRGQRTRRLAREVLAVLGISEDIDTLLRERPIRFAKMDATQLSLGDGEFDLLWSRAAMEHVLPPESALQEMARVVRPGGLLFHSIDPFYWLKGCHKGGVVDIPWAHARLTPAEFHRFVAETEGDEGAAKRSRHLRTLNQLTPREWRRTVEAAPFEILQWDEERSELAESLLEDNPDVAETVLNGVEPADLTCRQIKVWMQAAAH